MSDYSFIVHVDNRTRDWIYFNPETPVHGEWKLPHGDESRSVGPGQTESYLLNDEGLYGAEGSFTLSMNVSDYMSAGEIVRIWAQVACPVFSANVFRWHYNNANPWVEVSASGHAGAGDILPGEKITPSGHPAEVMFKFETKKMEGILDIWGEGRVETKDGMITGFNDAYNLNAEWKKVGTGDLPIPNHIKVPNWYPEYLPIPAGCAKYIVSMGSTLNNRVIVAGMCRILDPDDPESRIILYDGDVSEWNMLGPCKEDDSRETCLEHMANWRQFAELKKELELDLIEGEEPQDVLDLPAPFNEIDMHGRREAITWARVFKHGGR